jgi:hypothetical protein
VRPQTGLHGGGRGGEVEAIDRRGIRRDLHDAGGVQNHQPCECAFAGDGQLAACDDDHLSFVGRVGGGDRGVGSERENVRAGGDDRQRARGKNNFGGWGFLFPDHSYISGRGFGPLPTYVLKIFGIIDEAGRSDGQ